MPSRPSQQQLIRTLLMVAIFTVAIIGINALTDLYTGLFTRIGMAARSVLVPFSIAFLLSFIISPLARLIEGRTPLRRTLSVVAAIAIGIVFLLVVLGLTITFLVTQVATIVGTLVDTIDHQLLRGLLEDVFENIRGYLDAESFEETLQILEEQGVTPEAVLSWLGDSVAFVTDLATSIVSVAFTIILTPVFLYYLIKDRRRVFKGLANVFPRRFRHHVVTLGMKSEAVIRGYFVGQGLVMVFITVFFMVTYSLLSIFIPNFPIGYALLFAIVMGLFSIVPYLGVWVGMSMPIALFLTEHFQTEETTFIYLFGVAMVLVLNIIEEIIESTLVQPNVFSRQVRIHPLAVLSSFIFFGGVFGLVGFILAVPIAGTIKVTFNHFRSLNAHTSGSKEEPSAS